MLWVDGRRPRYSTLSCYHVWTVEYPEFVTSQYCRILLPLELANKQQQLFVLGWYMSSTC